MMHMQLHGSGDGTPSASTQMLLHEYESNNSRRRVNVSTAFIAQYLDFTLSHPFVHITEPISTVCMSTTPPTSSPCPSLDVLFAFPQELFSRVAPIGKIAPLS